MPETRRDSAVTAVAEMLRRQHGGPGLDPAEFTGQATAIVDTVTGLLAVEGIWPECPDGCGCRLGSEDADARDCGCDGPCTMECRENGYPDAPSYRDIAVQASKERTVSAAGDSPP